MVVSLTHALVDAYAGFVPPLLPRIMDKLGLSIALAATVAMTFSLATAVLQPILGWLADHHGRRAFVIGGPLLSAVFLSLIGLAPTFSVLLAFLILAGLGNAAFPPAPGLRWPPGWEPARAAERACPRSRSRERWAMPSDRSRSSGWWRAAGSRGCGWRCFPHCS